MYDDRTFNISKGLIMAFKEFATFGTLITPKILVAAYWVLTIIYIIAAVIFAFNGNFNASGLSILVLVITRISFELIMISFKNNEFLFRICNALEKDKQ